MTTAMDDLTDVGDANIDALTSILKGRFLSDRIFTRISYPVLVALHPFENLDDRMEEWRDQYYLHYKETKTAKPLPPHLFHHVNQAYFHMRRTGQDQTVVLTGMDGNGKHEMHDWLLSYLLTLSSHNDAGGKKKRVHQLIDQAHTLIKAFTHTQLAFGNNVSKLGRVTGFQFNDRGRLIGCAWDDAILETAACFSSLQQHEHHHSDSAMDDHAFFIFHYVLYGTSPRERDDLRLDQLPYAASGFAPTRQREALSEMTKQRYADYYNDTRACARAMGISKQQWRHACRILVALLFLGNVSFSGADATATSAYSAKDALLSSFSISNQPVTVHKKNGALSAAADLLGVDESALENMLVYKTQLTRAGDVTTHVLTAHQAAYQRDRVCQTLYTQLVHWLIAKCNAKLDASKMVENDQKTRVTNSLHIVNYTAIPIPSSKRAKPHIDVHNHDRFMTTFAHASLHHIMRCKLNNGDESVDNAFFFDSNAAFMHAWRSVQPSDDADMALASACEQMGITMAKQATMYHQNDKTIELPITHAGSGAVSRLFSLSALGDRLTSQVFADAAALFSENTCNLMLAVDLFHARNSIINASAARDPHNAVQHMLTTLDATNTWWILCLQPSVMRLSKSCDSKTLADQVAVHQLPALIRDLQTPAYTDLGLQECANRYVAILEEEGDDYSHEHPLYICQTMKNAFAWSDDDYHIDHPADTVFLSYATWYALENMLRSVEKQQQKHIKDALKEQHAYMDDASVLSGACHGAHGAIGGMHTCDSDYQCVSGCQQCEDSPTSASSYKDTASMNTSAHTHLNAKAGKRNRQCFSAPVFRSRSRFLWATVTWLITWWIPSPLLHYVGGMRRSDIRMAWREKCTLCFFILVLCAALVWFIALFGQLLCPPQDLFSQSELQSKSDKDNAFVAIRGEVFDLTSFAPRHWASEVIPAVSILQYAGQDASDLFPVQVSAVCDGLDQPIPKEVTLATHINITDPTAHFHDFRSFRDDYRPDWYMEQMVYLRKNYRLGFMGYDPLDIQNQAASPVQMGGIQTERQWAILHGHVYDLTSYLKGGLALQFPQGTNVSAQQQHANATSMDFIDNAILELFRQLPGTDLSAHFDALPFSAARRQKQLTCLRNLFFVGMVDSRNSLQCQFSEYLLLLITTFLCSVILFKFLAAFRMGGGNGGHAMPAAPPKAAQVDKKKQKQETTLTSSSSGATLASAVSSSASSHAIGGGKHGHLHDKFVICQVPCYTEGEDSLRKTIDSLAIMKYDDQRKLLFLVADGMIVGSGNDRSTPRIVLDILGVKRENHDDDDDAQPMDYVSLGDATRRHNRAKVYSGLYHCQGHAVPFLVIVKVGNDNERQKSGNRGKRDSQMILMQFLNKVHYDLPMTPLELEMHHQLKNIIGVMPAYYEFVLMVDADTEVAPESLNHMVASFSRDSKLVGLCGETLLSNEKDSWVTMIQVYEYYISHHLSKAFESLFGCVTCLPGCFCMYRIRAANKHQALFASHQVIEDYAENNVDTLHKKNLLHLGEDRYLTTLILKHFPDYRTKFNPDASCRTVGPDQWHVLLSQRRRWINSTVHNLGELLFLPQLCGLCCFSMRFIVMLDLLSTLVMPAVVCYLGYLVYQLCTSSSQVPLMSILTLGGVYGLQAILFITRRKWEHIGWMIVYILAIPVFSFLIPIYAFWHFDDFSWGNTRVVLEQKKKAAAAAAAATGASGTEKSPNAMLADGDVPLMHWSDDEDRRILLQEQQELQQQQDEKAAAAAAAAASASTASVTASVASAALYQANRPSRAFTTASMATPVTSSIGWVHGMMPPDDMLYSEIRHILNMHDLGHLTRKQVQDMLTNIFGIDMRERREDINRAIETILAEIA